MPINYTVQIKIQSKTSLAPDAAPCCDCSETGIQKFEMPKVVQQQQGFTQPRPTLRRTLYTITPLFGESAASQNTKLQTVYEGRRTRLRIPRKGGNNSVETAIVMRSSTRGILLRMCVSCGRHGEVKMVSRCTFRINDDTTAAKINLELGS